jgi:hypothetical protein
MKKFFLFCALIWGMKSYSENMEFPNFYDESNFINNPENQVIESFKVLDLNTWMILFLRKKANARTAIIGNILSHYDIVLLQEVFYKKRAKKIRNHLSKKIREDQMNENDQNLDLTKYAEVYPD